MRYFLLGVNTAKHEVAIFGLRLHNCGKTNLQANRFEILARACSVNGAAYSGRAMFIGHHDLRQVKQVIERRDVTQEEQLPSDRIEVVID